MVWAWSWCLIVILFLCEFVSKLTALRSSACVNAMMKAPANSYEVFNSVDFQADTTSQLYVCHVGYNLNLHKNGDNHVILHRSCTEGVWNPSRPVDCVRELRCGGLWFTRRSLTDDRTQCYLITRAKSWEHSRRMCWSIGAELLTIEDELEQQWLRRHIPTFNTLLPKGFKEAIDKQKGFIWLGLSNFQDGQTWRWVDEGDSPNYTRWSDGQPSSDVWTHYAYIDMWNDWQWYQSTNENTAIIDSLFTICEKDADEMTSSMLPVKMNRLIFVQQHTPFALQIKGIRQLISSYLKYEWGPIFLDNLYQRLSSANYARILDNILSGNGRVVESFVNVSSVHEYRLLKYNPKSPDEVIHVFKCTEKESKAETCGFHLYNTGGEDDFTIYFNITRSMSHFFSTTYKLEMPLIGVSERFYVFNVESGTSLTSWSAWLGCECNMESRKTESRRFRLCLSVIKPRLYKEACRNLESAAEYQTRMCQHDLCGGSLTHWSEWSSCNAQCAEGQQSRYKICDVTLLSCNKSSHRVYEYRSCSSACDFGEVASVDIEAWILSDPQLAQEIEGLQQGFRPKPEFGSGSLAMSLHSTNLVLPVYPCVAMLYSVCT